LFCWKIPQHRISAVVQALRARHPELPAEVLTQNSPAGAQQDPAAASLIRCGNELVAVMSIPAPIPEDAGLWSRAARNWPESQTVAERHRGHLIVSVLGKNDQPLEQARQALVLPTEECSQRARPRIMHSAATTLLH
jgi:hypothetical protein